MLIFLLIDESPNKSNKKQTNGFDIDLSKFQKIKISHSSFELKLFLFNHFLFLLNNNFTSAKLIKALLSSNFIGKQRNDR
jgi:hypothetical protein